jgi:transposase InsO family protein
MCRENPLWGAPRIHGELLKLGFEIAESTVSTYMIRRRTPPSQHWRTFLRNHADAIAAIDLCVVPTVTFELLFAFVVLGHGRRQLLWFGVTRHPTAEWLGQQIVEAFPWNAAADYLVRDNDRAYGQAFRHRIRTMGIRDRPTSPRSPWQNAYAERLIGTLRRDCLDHVLIFGVQHLRQVLTSYSSTTIRPARIYHWTRTRRCGGRSSDAEPLSPRPFCRACIISMLGYDFWEGQGGVALTLTLGRVDGDARGQMTCGLQIADWDLGLRASARRPAAGPCAHPSSPTG